MARIKAAESLRETISLEGRVLGSNTNNGVTPRAARKLIDIDFCEPLASSPPTETRTRRRRESRETEGGTHASSPVCGPQSARNKWDTVALILTRLS